MPSPRFHRMLRGAQVGDVFFVETDNPRAVMQGVGSRASALGMHITQRSYVATSKKPPWSVIQIVRVEVTQVPEEVTHG